MRVIPITTDWLLSERGTGWRVARGGPRDDGYWRAWARGDRGRIGPVDGLPSLIEVALLADRASRGPTHDLMREYREFNEALLAWVSRWSDERSEGLARLLSRLRDPGRPAP